MFKMSVNGLQTTDSGNVQLKRNSEICPKGQNSTKKMSFCVVLLAMDNFGGSQI